LAWLALSQGTIWQIAAAGGTGIALIVAANGRSFIGVGLADNQNLILPDASGRSTLISPLPSVPVEAIVNDEFSPAWVARHTKASDADIYDPSVAKFQ
jgi:hypothetical protein